MYTPRTRRVLYLHVIITILPRVPHTVAVVCGRGGGGSSEFTLCAHNVYTYGGAAAVHIHIRNVYRLQNPYTARCIILSCRIFAEGTKRTR